MRPDEVHKLLILLDLGVHGCAFSIRQGTVFPEGHEVLPAHLVVHVDEIVLPVVENSLPYLLVHVLNQGGEGEDCEHSEQTHT